jgi:plasmid stabilization system protein ParE
LKRRVRLLPLARRDLARLEEFLSSKSPQAANKAAAAIRKAVLSLDQHAERGRLGPVENTRELPVEFGRDGYVIQYRVSGDTVSVARIFHTREQR